MSSLFRKQTNGISRKQGIELTLFILGIVAVLTSLVALFFGIYIWSRIKNVDNTRDIDKPISAQQQRINNMFEGNILNMEDIIGWEGKKVLIIGDSISDEELYPNCWVKDFRTLCEKIGIEVYNYSRQGRTIGKYEGVKNYLMNVVDGIPENDYDEIIVFLGANDWLNQVSLGSIDTEDTDSVIYNITEFNNWASEKYPSSHITFVTPLRSKRENDLRHKLTQMYATAIVSGAVYNGDSVIDAHSYSPFMTIDSLDDWTLDGLHPKEEYSPYLARYLFNCFLSKDSNIGLSVCKTRVAIGDLGGSNKRVCMLYDGMGKVSYVVDSFKVSSTGSVKLADLPEECQTVAPVYGTGLLVSESEAYEVVLFTNESELYVYIPHNVPNGYVSGQTMEGFVKYSLNVENISY